VRVALNSFGGPAGQMSVMYKILVEEKRWISEERFLHALNYTMLLPGPEAQQLATYIGWLLHSTRGGLVAGILFIIPGFLSILFLSILYSGFQDFSIVQAIFFGLKPAVMAIVVEAVFRIGRRALKNRVMIAIAAGAFIAIFFFNIPFPFIVLTAGLLGYFGGKFAFDHFDVLRVIPPKTKENIIDSDPIISNSTLVQTQPSTKRSLRVLVTSLALWFVPILLLMVFLGEGHIFVDIALFFSKTAVVTFGGAYAVLAYITQQAVDVFGWLQPGQMLDGLGMAETTPGPLIQVVQFVGYMAAYQFPANLNPYLSAFYASLITTWVTFVPCFLWIFLGAPYIEYLRGNKYLSTALAAITAAVVGVILNLALWFSLQTLFSQVETLIIGTVRMLVPLWNTIDWASLMIAVAAFYALFRLKWGMIATLSFSALIGLVYYLIFLG
jgi:chromate transporter